MKQSLSHFVTAPFTQGSRKKPSLPKGGWHGEAVTGGLRKGICANEKQSLTVCNGAPFTQGSRLARIPDKAEILISAKRNANQRTERKGKNTHKPLQEKT